MQLGFWIKKLSENISLHMYFVYFPVAVKAKDSCFIFTTGHVRLQRLWNWSIQEVSSGNGYF